MITYSKLFKKCFILAIGYAYFASGMEKPSSDNLQTNRPTRFFDNIIKEYNPETFKEFTRTIQMHYQFMFQQQMERDFAEMLNTYSIPDQSEITSMMTHDISSPVTENIPQDPLAQTSESRMYDLAKPYKSNNGYNEYKSLTFKQEKSKFSPETHKFIKEELKKQPILSVTTKAQQILLKRQQAGLRKKQCPYESLRSSFVYRKNKTKKEMQSQDNQRAPLIIPDQESQ